VGEELTKKEQARQSAIAKLTDKQVLAYNFFLESAQPALAPSLNAQLFELFLTGKDCDEIRRLNPAITLGQIVAARLQGDWDLRRDEYTDSLLDRTTERVRQSTLESALLVCDMLSVVNKEHGDAMRRYLQSGDTKELPSFRINTMQGFKYAVEVLQKLSGQDRQQQVKVSGTVNHELGDEDDTVTATGSDLAILALKGLLGK
jgi:hypothetical protein